MISTLNQSTAVWEMSPMATVIEQEVIRWLADRAGYPDTSLGTAVSGGSAANLTALLAARARWNAKSGVGRRGQGVGEEFPFDTRHPTPDSLTSHHSLLGRRALLDRARGIDHGHRGGGSRQSCDG